MHLRIDNNTAQMTACNLIIELIAIVPTKNCISTITYLVFMANRKMKTSLTIFVND